MLGATIVPALTGGVLPSDVPSWTPGVSTSANAGPSAANAGSAIRAYFGTSAVSASSADSALAYTEALSQATWIIGELLAILERSADIEGGLRVDNE
jgi:hypothetical protein